MLHRFEGIVFGKWKRYKYFALEALLEKRELENNNKRPKTSIEEWIKIILNEFISNELHKKILANDRIRIKIEEIGITNSLEIFL